MRALLPVGLLALLAAALPLGTASNVARVGREMPKLKRAITGYLPSGYWSRMEFHYMSFPSWQHIVKDRPDIKLDMLVFGDPSIDTVLRQDCVMVDLRVRDNLDDWSDILVPESQCIYVPYEEAYMQKKFDFPFMNNFKHFLDPKAIKLMSNYDRLVKADYDVFWSPTFVDYWPETFVFGQQLFVVVDETVTNLKAVASALNLTYADRHNLGATWYGDLPTLMALSEKMVPILDYMISETWPQKEDGVGPSPAWRTGEGWPEWSVGIAALYAGELAANDLGFPYEINDKFDVWSDKSLPMKDVLAVHTQHGATNFDKFKFFGHKYEKLDLDLLDLTMLPEFCAHMAVTSWRARRENWCIPHSESNMETRPDHDSGPWNKQLRARNKREGRLTPHEAKKAAEAAAREAARSRSLQKVRQRRRVPLEGARAVVTYLPMDEDAAKEFVVMTHESWKRYLADAPGGVKYDLILYGPRDFSFLLDDVAGLEFTEVELKKDNGIEDAVDPSQSQFLLVELPDPRGPGGGARKRQEMFEGLRVLTDPLSRELLNNYQYIFKTEHASFFTRELAYFEPDAETIHFGRQLVHFHPSTATAIESVRLELDLNRKEGDTRINFGFSMFGEVDALSSVAEMTAEVAAHMLENEFTRDEIRTQEGFPQWTVAHVQHYATEVAAHHLGMPFSVDARFDAPSDTAALVDNIFHIHPRLATSTGETAKARFSRADFVTMTVPHMGPELQEVLDSLDSSIVRDFCMITGARAMSRSFPLMNLPDQLPVPDE